MKNQILCLTLISTLLASCGNNERFDREAYEGGKKDMQVKKVSEVEITSKAYEMGDEIATAAQQELMATLTKAIGEHGVVGAVDFCSLEAMPLLQSVGEKYNAEIRRVSNRYRNPEAQPDEQEQMLLSAYEYNEENDIKSKPNVQKIDDGQVLLYTKAIHIPGQLCLNCHGQDIDPKVSGKINQLYPQDKATGHQEGDLRGMWSMRIPRKEVINNL